MKPYRFQFSSKAESEFALFAKNLQIRILKKLAFFENSKTPLSFSKKLQGSDNIFRFRIGDYRVLVMSKDREVFVILIILKIGHRRDVYG